MKFALVEGVRVSAQPKLRGTCVCCSSEVIAKCGRYKIWHWARKSTDNCDPWWENETAWHRRWKSFFPNEWQEFLQVDPISGERHFADVRTDTGTVIEFQRSSISTEEVSSRELFYTKMLWIIDGMKNDFDKSHFSICLGKPVSEDPALFPIQWYSRSKLLDRWCQSANPIYIDFGDEHLWRLLKFNPTTKRGVVAAISKKALVEGLGGTYP